MKPTIKIWLRLLSASYWLNLCVTGIAREKLYFNTYLSIVSDLQENRISIFQTFLEISILTCVEECKLTRVCRFINFHVQTHTCDLIKSSTDSVFISKVTGYVFGRRTDWDLSSLSLCSSCADNERCTRETGTPECEVNACGQPEVANGTIVTGNVYKINARLKYACATGYTIIGRSPYTCQVNGSWSSLNTCTEEPNLCPLTTDYKVTTLSDGALFKSWLVEVTYDQADALDLCLSCQGRLVEILSHPKMNFLRFWLMNKADGFDYWVDGSNANATDYFSDNAWTTSSGATIPMSSVLWAPGTPNAQNIEHCVRMKSALAYHLDNRVCEAEYRVICEK